MEIISRKEAGLRGLKRYFTGNPCPRGHIDERRHSNGECCECARASARDRRERDPELHRERCRKWYWQNPSRAISMVRRYQSTEEGRLSKVNAEAKRRAAMEGGASTGELAEWVDSQDKSCYWCSSRCDDDYHIDHYTPLSKGGRHEIDNLVISCPTCNVRKSAKDPYEYANSIGRLF